MTERAARLHTLRRRLQRTERGAERLLAALLRELAAAAPDPDVVPGTGGQARYLRLPGDHTHGDLARRLRRRRYSLPER